jgi:hypothetical protein
MPTKLIRESVEIGGIHFFIDDPNIAKDHFTKQWLIKDNAYPLAYQLNSDKDGLVGIHGYVYIKSHVLLNDNNCYTLKSRHGSYIIARDYKIVGTGKLYPSINEDEPNVLYDEYMHKKLNNKKKFRAFDNLVKPFNDFNNPNLCDEDRKYLLERDLEFGVRTITNKIFEGLNYTFGIELETSSGRVSDKEAEGLNLKCEFDGSLRDTPDQKKEDVLGGEYITGVLTGDSGMKQLNKVCNILSENCTINSKCGVHVHIGNLKFTKENIVYMYILGKLLENEIFSIMPKSRRNNSYCRALKDLGLRFTELRKSTPFAYDVQIDEYFNLVFKEVSGGRLPDRKINKLYNHPSGSKCGYDKNAQRYCWLNFVTAMFDTKKKADSYTLEFRIHYATLNYIKIKNWLKICVAFVNFAENHQASIRRGYWMNPCGEKFQINLTSIILASYPKSNRTLIEYLEERKNRFLLDNDDIEALEYSKDKEGVTDLNIKECVL